MDTPTRRHLARAVALSALPVAMAVAVAGVGAADPGQGRAPVNQQSQLTVDAGVTAPPAEARFSTGVEAVPIPAPMPDPVPDITHQFLDVITSLTEELVGALAEALPRPLWLGSGR
ncbi:hypothetical protein [Nocardia sp. NPDC047038]|uniref:hypothetical protein n=1 Tax=Nocardia sp. NPDC047038 TaxID=3154338 RepID=UPI0033C5458E